MADTLETLENLAVWTGKDPEIVEADPFAQMVLERATELVVEKAEIPAAWVSDPTLVPSRAKTICLLLAARTYTNRRSVISQSVGPISESILAAMAAAMQLTEAEAEELEGMANSEEPFGGLWVLATTRGTDVPIIDTVNLPDSSGSDWLIPYAVEGETGAFDIMADGGVSPEEFAALQALVNSLVTTKADVTALVNGLALKANSTDMTTALAAKATIVALTSGLAAKADSSALTSGLAGKADTSALTSGLASKADASALTAKADKTYVDSELADKAEQSDLVAGLAIKASTSALTTGLAGKADQSTVDASLALKADADDVAAALAEKVDLAALGVQIRMEQPESGSGELWADTEA